MKIAAVLLATLAMNVSPRARKGQCVVSDDQSSVPKYSCAAYDRYGVLVWNYYDCKAVEDYCRIAHPEGFQLVRYKVEWLKECR